MIHYATLLIGAIAALLGLGAMNALNLPIALIAIGFVALGHSLPDVLFESTKYSKTLWMPLGFLAASVAGSFIVFQGSAIQILLGAQWCPIAPCIPVGWMIACFLVGNIAKLASTALKGEKLDLFGEHVKD